MGAAASAFRQWMGWHNWADALYHPLGKTQDQTSPFPHRIYETTNETDPTLNANITRNGGSIAAAHQFAASRNASWSQPSVAPKRHRLTPPPSDTGSTESTSKRQRTEHSRNQNQTPQAQRKAASRRTLSSSYRHAANRRTHAQTSFSRSHNDRPQGRIQPKPRSSSFGDKFPKSFAPIVPRKPPTSRDEVDEAFRPREQGLFRETSAYVEPPRLQLSNNRLRDQRVASGTSEQTLNSLEHTRPQTQTEDRHSVGDQAWEERVRKLTEVFNASASRRPAQLSSKDGVKDLNYFLGSLTTDDEPRLSQRKQDELDQKRKARELEKLRIQKEEEQKKAQEEAEARLKRRLPKKPLVASLKGEWEDKVNNAVHTNDHNRVVTTSIGGTELIPKDFGTLLGSRAWLNDEIINSYIEWVVEAANKLAPPNQAVGKEKPVPKYIAHNSFFYENITKKGPTSTDRLMKRKGAPGKALMQVDSIIVPICRGSHWTVGVVRPAFKTIEYFDSFGGQSKLSKEFKAHMRSWLQHQLGDYYVASEWEEPDTGCASQSNGWDCGVFVCTNAFCVAFGLETSCYVERDMEMQRRRIAAVLINRGFHGDFSWSNEGW